MTNVCFAGITGWTAAPIVAAIAASDDLTLTAGVSRSAAGQDIATVTSSNAGGSIYGTVTAALRSAPVDVVVDFTSATAVKTNVVTAIEAGIHVVVGSSGLTAADYAEIDRTARDRGVGVIAAGNFSVMAAVLLRAASLAAEHLEHWEVLDYASDQKPDVPSGTSRELAETLGSVHRPGTAIPLPDLHGPVEARGAEVGGHPDPFHPVARFRRDDRGGVRWIRGTTCDAPRSWFDRGPVRRRDPPGDSPRRRRARTAKRTRLTPVRRS
ncbi:4-hydroxy-tetrahydrodipicolinate reductase [Kribbella sp. NBC_01510]